MHLLPARCGWTEPIDCERPSSQRLVLGMPDVGSGCWSGWRDPSEKRAAQCECGHPRAESRRIHLERGQRQSVERTELQGQLKLAQATTRAGVSTLAPHRGSPWTS